MTPIHPFKLYIVTHTCTLCNTIIRQSPLLPGTFIQPNLTTLQCSTSQAGPCPNGCDTSAGSFNLCVKLSIDQHEQRIPCFTFLHAIFLSLKYLKYTRK